LLWLYGPEKSPGLLRNGPQERIIGIIGKDWKELLPVTVDIFQFLRMVLREWSIYDKDDYNSWEN